MPCHGIEHPKHGWKALHNPGSEIRPKTQASRAEASEKPAGGITAEIAAVGGRILGKLFGGEKKDS